MAGGRDPLAHPEELLQRVYAYVAYRVGDPAAAEDITSATFERALRYRDRFDAAKGEPIAWLLGIARNCVYDTLLQPAEQELSPTVADEGDVETEVVGRLTLRQALASLSASDRELLALRYGADLAPREIGRLLDRKRNAVDVALARARARLATALEADTPESRAVEQLAPDLVDGTL